MPDRPRIVIVSEHASTKFGGEAALPMHYFRVLRRRGFHVWLITHARTRDELTRLFPGEDRILYVEDAPLHRFLWRVSLKMPAAIAHFTVGFIQRFSVQLAQRKLVRRLVAEQGIDVIHQPMPVSPREPSMMYGFGVPVIIGPMNGGMNFPPAFRHRQAGAERLILGIGRLSSSIMNWLMPGKRRAALLLVANQRTRRALPAGASNRVVELVENGVDLALWSPNARAAELEDADRPTTFAFVGRLVHWKAVDILLLAFQRAASRSPMRLLVIGDGDERSRLEALAAELGIVSGTGGSGGVQFTGWLAQDVCAERLRQADCLVIPSLNECGGAVVLEAMSTGKPVIATAWGGPADYLDDSCGVLVPPTDREALIEGFAQAMVRLASSRDERRRMGDSGRAKVIREYDWEVKVDTMLALYEAAQANSAG